MNTNNALTEPSSATLFNEGTELGRSTIKSLQTLRKQREKILNHVRGKGPGKP